MIIKNKDRNIIGIIGGLFLLKIAYDYSFQSVNREIENLEEEIRYSWDNLELSIQKNLKTLGWNKKSWNTQKNVPSSENKNWNQLNKNEKIAIRNLGINQNYWNLKDNL